jgi:hypothetical protein
MYFNQQIIVSNSLTYDPGCSSRLRIPDPDPEFFTHPDPGVKKAPDPGSETTTLVRYGPKREEEMVV